MRSHSFQPLLALSALLTQAVADEGHGHAGPADDDTEVVTVWVESTVTTCPTPVAPPPLCPDVPIVTSTTTISSTVTVTTSTSKGPIPPTSKHTQPSTSKTTPTGAPTPPTSKSTPTVAPTSSTSKPSHWWPTWMSSKTTTKPTTVPTSTGSLTKTTTTTKPEPDTTTTKTKTESKTTTVSGTKTTATSKSWSTSEKSSTTSKPTTAETSTTSSKTTTTSKTWPGTSSTSTTPTTSKSSTTTPASSTTNSKSSTTASNTSTTTSKTTTTSATTSPTAKPDACSQYWLDALDHQGVAPYAVSGNGYKVYRNVKEYGAKGDGQTDDTAAINKAISDGDRCGRYCDGSTTEPALIYFPPGTYIVSDVLYLYYYTMMIGHPTCLPVIKASKNFKKQTDDPTQDQVLFKTNPYEAGGPWWKPQNVFWRQVANFEFDTTDVDPTRQFVAIQWPSSQATSLTNIVFKLSAASNTRHIGLQITEGSGGYVGDLVLHGGDRALSVGNQQFTFRNISISNAKTAVYQIWSWGWLYQGVTIRNCGVGFDVSHLDPGNGELLVGSVTIIDSEISNTPVGIKLGDGSRSANKVAGNSIILENLQLNNVPEAVRGASSTVLAGSTGSQHIPAWGRGNTYTGNASKKPTFVQGAISPNSRPSSLLAGTHFYARSKPQYAQEPLSSFVSARSAGAKGDGVADDTKALNDLIASAAAAGKIVFLDAGYYRVTGTIRIPAGARITAEAYPIILSSGSYFADASNPKPVVQIGAPGEAGSIEWSNTVVSTKGAQAGAILIEYNLDSPTSRPSGLWDVHVRIGGFAGSDLQVKECSRDQQLEKITAENVRKECISGFLSMHITKSSAGLLMENCWVWVADHDLERNAGAYQITVYSGRGMLIESKKGNIWMWGGAVEHHQLYEYQMIGAGPVVLGHIQTETAYYQPNPDANIPFAAVSKYHDPVYSADESGLGVRIIDSDSVLIYGAGLYSFFDNYAQDCLKGAESDCQKRVLTIENSSVTVYNLVGVGVVSMVTVDGVDVASAVDNYNGFPQTVAMFRTSDTLLV